MPKPTPSALQEAASRPQADQIEITPVMVRAGLEAYIDWRGQDCDDLMVAEIYRAMVAAPTARQSRKRCGECGRPVAPLWSVPAKKEPEDKPPPPPPPVDWGGIRGGIPPERKSPKIVKAAELVNVVLNYSPLRRLINR